MEQIPNNSTPINLQEQSVQDMKISAGIGAVVASIVLVASPSADNPESSYFQNQERKAYESQLKEVVQELGVSLNTKFQEDLNSLGFKKIEISFNPGSQYGVPVHVTFSGKEENSVLEQGLNKTSKATVLSETLLITGVTKEASLNKDEMEKLLNSAISQEIDRFKSSQ